MTFPKLCRYLGFAFSGYALSSFVQLEEGTDRTLGIGFCVLVIVSALTIFYFLDRKANGRVHTFPTSEPPPKPQQAVKSDPFPEGDEPESTIEL